MADVFRRILAAAALIIGCAAPALSDPITLRIGHFPNITHAQAVIAHGLSRQGRGWFEQRLGPDVKIDWYVYNAGPSAMEAIFADSIDLTFVGPSPAINGFARAHGRDVRIIAGAIEGGSALVVQPDEKLTLPADFRGKKIATPQLGNTQDVSARSWLKAGGVNVTPTGGEAEVLPTENPDQLALFKTHQLDGVWTVEPWVSRLVMEAGGKVLVDERDAVTTVVVSGVKFLDGHRDLARKFVAAESELTDWIIAHPDAAKGILRDEIAAETHGAISAELVANGWSRIVPTTRISSDALSRFVAKARDAGFLRSTPDIAGLVDIP
jgi:NitT/TauT family transport system substrate-binding protein